MVIIPLGGYCTYVYDYTDKTDELDCDGRGGRYGGGVGDSVRRVLG